MGIIEVLDKAILHENQITINRLDLNDCNSTCIPIQRSEKLLLLHWIDDFLPDGYKIFRITDISDVRCDETDKFYEMILRKEGIYGQLNNPNISNITSWKTTLEEISNHYNHIIIECEDLEEFYIGNILNFLNNGIEFLNFDPRGKWDKEIDFINYNDITCITLDDRYTNIISKYLSQL